MKRGTTLFLKVSIFLIGITILGLCIFWLPWLGDNTAKDFPEFAYLKNPVLFGLYVTSLPFFFALYQSLKLLSYIEYNKDFSELSVKSLNDIKYCALIISALYVIGSIYLISQSAFHPGIAMLGFTIIFTSVVIAVFSAVLQKLLKNALDLKSENDLTV